MQIFILFEDCELKLMSYLTWRYVEYMDIANNANFKKFFKNLKKVIILRTNYNVCINITSKRFQFIISFYVHIFVIH